MAHSAQPLRILHLMSGFGGGISSFVMNKAREMTQYQTTFDVALYDTVNEEFATAIQQTGGQIYQLRNPKKAGWQAFKKSVMKPLQEHKYDIIHCHIEGYRMLPLYYLCKRYSHAPFYIHAHTVHPPKGKHFVKARQSFNQYINRHVTKVPVGCGLLAIDSVFGEADARNILPNSINQDAFQLTDEEYQNLRTRYRQQYGIADDTLLIGHVGRLAPVKNHQKTLAIANYLRAHRIDAKILIIGSGTLESQLQQQINEQQLTDYIYLTGRIAPITDIYPALDAMILPSLTEGLPTTVVESQAAGLPMLMSDTITNEVDLGLGIVATLSLDASADDWAQQLLAMVQQPVPDLSARIQRLDETGYTNRAAGKIYVDYFRRALAQAKGGYTNT